MAENTRVRISPEVRNLLTSPSPDLGPLFAPETGRPVRPYEAKKLLSEAHDFLQQHGTPPWHRLGLQNLIYLSHGPVGSDNKGVLMFCGEGVAIVNERLATREQVQGTFDHMVDWATKSPLRTFSFPLADKFVTMMVTNPAAEAEARRMSRFLVFEKARVLPLHDVEPENCLLAVRSNAWVSPEGNPRWLGSYLKREGAVKIEGESPFNRLAIRSFRALLSLAQREVRNNPRPIA